MVKFRCSSEPEISGRHRKVAPLCAEFPARSALGEAEWIRRGTDREVASRGLGFPISIGESSIEIERKGEGVELSLSLSLFLFSCILEKI